MAAIADNVGSRQHSVDRSNANCPSATQVTREGHLTEPNAPSGLELIEPIVADRGMVEAESPGSGTGVGSDKAKSACPKAEDRPGHPVSVVAPPPATLVGDWTGSSGGSGQRPTVPPSDSHCSTCWVSGSVGWVIERRRGSVGNVVGAVADTAGRGGTFGRRVLAGGMSVGFLPGFTQRGRRGR